MAVEDTCICGLQAGVKHIVLAVSYRAEMLEQEMTVEAQKVSSCGVDIR